MRAVAVVVVALAAGCYNPAVPTGGYLCNPTDHSCPSGQHCTCGLCVAADSQAACKFVLAATTGGATPAVAEHEPFALSVQAVGSDGATVAAGFSGTVTLTSTWGDVTPSSVALVDGQATAMVSLNRETLPPQTAAVIATFAGNRGVSNKIAVTAPPFVRDAAAVVPPPAPGQPFGFADVAVAQPDVIKTASGWRMYFNGLSASPKLGVATSTEGKSFTATATPLLAAGGAAFDANAIRSPSAFTLAGGMVNLAFTGMSATGSDIGIATSPDGLAAFTLANGGQPVVKRSDCGFCTTRVEAPDIIPDPENPSGWLMFFDGVASSSVGIGRATSKDGVHFTVEPAPILSGDAGNEAVLLAPQVVLDGSVFKMWYSVARLGDFKPGNECLSNIGIGYATSSDGYFWVRSPSNPVLQTGGGGWDGAITSFLAGSVVPSDGADPQSGFVLYYTTYRMTQTGAGMECLPNGIGRATRS